MSFSKGAELEWWSSSEARKDYIQIGNGVYRRGIGIYYTIHGASRLMRQSFLRRYHKGKKVSPSTARFNRRNETA